MLIFGDPTPRAQRGMPHPAIRFALAILIAAGAKAVLHSFDCCRLPTHLLEAASGLREVVYSTTRDEIEEHAARQFGEEGWVSCGDCGG
jgi:hypothetical protein